MNHSNTIIPGSKDKPILLDVFINNRLEKRPAVIFCHGYKGFKDWGAWNLMGDIVSEGGFNLVKFNFSYNGTTIENPLDFDDLDAFGNNNYVTELNDLEKVIDWVEQEKGFEKYFDTQEIYLIGHSRGGGIVLLKANEDSRIKKVITWAGVSDFVERVPKGKELEQWKKDGVRYERNGRTNQNMPIYYQFMESLEANKSRLDIESAVRSTSIPILVIHGEDDPVVKLQEANNLASWNPKAELVVVKNTAHTFDTKHPWEEKGLPNAFKQVVEETLRFCALFEK